MNNSHSLKGDMWIDAPTIIEAEHREKLNKIMNKQYIVKNCPAGQIVTSAVNPNLAGVYCKMTHGPCQDCVDCISKRIIKMCKKTKGFSAFDVGEKNLAESIFNLMDIEEI